jgi:hypothetical protein
MDASLVAVLGVSDILAMASLNGSVHFCLGVFLVLSHAGENNYRLAALVDRFSRGDTYIINDMIYKIRNGGIIYYDCPE